MFKHINLLKLTKIAFMHQLIAKKVTTFVTVYFNQKKKNTFSNISLKLIHVTVLCKLW